MTFSTNTIHILYKPLILAGLFLFPFYIFLSDNHLNPYRLHGSVERAPPPEPYNEESTILDSSYVATNISHIVVAIAGTVNPLRFRKAYIESWWKPNVTKGYLFLDREPTGFLPWAPSSPPYRIYEDTWRYKPYNKHPMKDAIRMVRLVLEAYRESHEGEGVRWFVMTDDDTILFMDNLVEVLSRYDHSKYFYIGESSESIYSNYGSSFEMGFGGAGFAVSYPLAQALSLNLDVCIKRYPSLYGSDHMIQSCVADLGVSLTHEKGFHQIDLHRDISGFLSSLPQSPLVSLHHLDRVDPLFPSMNRIESLNHLMKAAKIDESRLLQQTICYDGSKNWSFSIAWGYSAQVYEKIIPPSVLQKPLETFIPWRRSSGLPYMFNTRWISKDPCELPHYFSLESVEKVHQKDEIVSSYTRRFPWKFPPCSSNLTANGFVGHIHKLIVVSPSARYSSMGGNRRECCDIVDQVEKNVTKIEYRACMKNEIIGVD